MNIDQPLAPPHSIEAEQYVLGALLMWPQAFERIEFLNERAFYRHDHRLIYGAIAKLVAANQPVDVFTVESSLPEKEQIDRQYLGSMAVSVPSAANIVRYAQIVREKWRLREAAAVGMSITERAFAADTTADDIVQFADAKIHELAHETVSSELAPFHETLDAALRWRERDAALSTGFIDLDRLMPLRGGEFVIIAGRPSMGKSALATNIAEHVAAREPVAFFSMEMSRANIGNRILSWHARNHEHPEDHLTSLLLFIETPSVLTVESLRLKVRRHKRQHGCALVVVDYLTMMRGRGENRTQEVGSISRGLKSVAIELDVPLIAVAQLNRANEGRMDHRPLLADLRESGDIEQDADIVAMVYRDEYYHPDSEARGTAEIIVRKSRNGPIGTCRLAWLNDYARFQNHAGSVHPMAPRAPKPMRMVVKEED